ncbi:MAG: sulfatase-like hydrolase/transferase [Myxococcota bacterium]|nr:sulfatase-like hydrolase/transferase [Myxococcota bacterium]
MELAFAKPVDAPDARIRSLFHAFCAVACFSWLALFSLALIFPGLALAQTSEPEPPPHILFIIGDDHGWPNSGFMGDPIVQTPELDLLAAQGTVFNYGYATASVCAPSLQTLLTGLHPHQWILQKNQIEAEIGTTIPRGVEVSYFEDTLPRRVSELGYRSFQAGKHWEGTYDMAGFDAGTAETFVPGQFLAPGRFFGRPDPIDPLWDFIDTSSGEPLLLWLAPMLPHVPFDPPAHLKALYEGQGLDGNAVLYYANITRLDALIGDILGGFSDRGMLENTLIIYLSDNGWEQKPFTSHWAGWLIGGAKGKLSIYELGFRTPIIFTWPGHVPEGRVLNDLVSFEDVHATILDYAGASGADESPGFSLRPRIEELTDVPVREAIVGVMNTQRTREEEFDLQPGTGLGRYTTGERAAFIRSPEWRYLAYIDRGESELYKIDLDPFEESDLSTEFPDVASVLDGAMQDWLETYLAVPEPSSGLLGSTVVLVFAFLRRRSERLRA